MYQTPAPAASGATHHQHQHALPYTPSPYQPNGYHNQSMSSDQQQPQYHGAVSFQATPVQPSSASHLPPHQTYAYNGNAHDYSYGSAAARAPETSHSNSLIVENQRLVSENTALRFKVVALEDQVLQATPTDTLRSVNQQIELQAAYDALQVEYQQMKLMLLKAKNVIDGLQTEVELQKAYNHRQHQQQAADVHAHAEQHQQQLQALQAQIDASNKELTNLQAELSHRPTTAAHDELKRRNTIDVAIIHELRSQLNQMKQISTEREQTTSNQQTLITTLQKQIESVQQQSQQHDQVVQQYEQALAEREQELQQLHQQSQTLALDQQLVDKQSSTIATLQHQLKELRAEHSMLKLDTTSLEAYQKLEDRYEAQQKELQHAKQQVQKARQRVRLTSPLHSPIQPSSPYNQSTRQTYAHSPTAHPPGKRFSGMFDDSTLHVPSNGDRPFNLTIQTPNGVRQHLHTDVDTLDLNGSAAADASHDREHQQLIAAVSKYKRELRDKERECRMLHNQISQLKESLEESERTVTEQKQTILQLSAAAHQPNLSNGVSESDRLQSPDRAPSGRFEALSPATKAYVQQFNPAPRNGPADTRTQQDNARLQSRVAQLTNELQQQQLQSVSKQKYEQVESTLSTLKQQLRQREEELYDLQQQLQQQTKAAADTTEDLQGTLHQLQHTNAQLQHQSQQYDDQLQQQRQSLQSVIDLLQQIAHKHFRDHALISPMHSHDQDVSRCTMILHLIESELTSSHTQRTQLQQVERQLTECQAQLQATISEKSGIQLHLADVEQRLQRAEATLDETHSSMLHAEDEQSQHYQQLLGQVQDLHAKHLAAVTESDTEKKQRISMEQQLQMATAEQQQARIGYEKQLEQLQASTDTLLRELCLMFSGIRIPVYNSISNPESSVSELEMLFLQNTSATERHDKCHRWLRAKCNEITRIRRAFEYTCEQVEQRWKVQLTNVNDMCDKQRLQINNLKQQIQFLATHYSKPLQQSRRGTRQTPSFNASLSHIG